MIISKSINLSSSLVIILGPGRSGTSLLQSMLDSHSQVKFIKENQFLRKVLYGRSSISWFLENRKDRLNNLDYLDNYKTLNKLEFYKKMINKESKPEIKYIGDKDPNLLDHIEKLILDFNNPKIMVTMRDPRDIILSRIKAKWSSKWPFFLQILIVYSQLIRYNKFQIKNKLASNQIHTIKYENLLYNAPLEIYKICDFLNLKYEKQMLDFRRSSKRLVTKDEMQWKAKTLQKLDKNNFNNWKNQFNSGRIYLLNRVFKKILIQYNYEIQDNLGLSFMSKLYYSIQTKLIRIFSNLYNFRYL